MALSGRAGPREVPAPQVPGLLSPGQGPAWFQLIFGDPITALSFWACFLGPMSSLLEVGHAQ